MKVGCLGPRGTFSHIVLQSYMENKGKYSEHLFSDFQKLIEALKECEIDIAICPIENSQEGAVNEIVDALAFESGLFINDEYIQKISHCLLSQSRDSSSGIEIVFSHPQAINQCRQYMDLKFPDIEYSYTSSTATAAERALAYGPSAGVIGSEKLKNLYPLKVLENDIQDNKSNCTRFVMVSRNQRLSENADKTSIAFSIQHSPGELHKILGIFDVFGINLLKIESRPAKTILGEYIFLIDFQGNCADKDISLALQILSRKVKYYKLIGCYEHFDPKNQ